jgi:hypothetical protein
MEERLVFSRNDQDDIRNEYVSAFVRMEMHGHKNEVKKVPAYGFKLRFKVVKKMTLAEVAEHLLDNLGLTDPEELEEYWMQYYDEYNERQTVYYHEFKLL